MAWTQQLPSGNWRALYRDGEGKTRSAGTFPHKAKAIAKATQAEEEAHLPGWRDPRAGARKWGEWCDQWWPTRTAANAKNDLSPLNKWIKPHWQDVPLASITRYDVKAWASHMYNEGLAESSVKRYVSIFSSSLSAAVDAEILQANPAFGLKLPMGEVDVVRFLKRKQVRRILDALESEQDKALVSLLVGTGMRWGEAVGLHGRRVDLKNGMVRIAETWDTKNRRMKRYP